MIHSYCYRLVEMTTMVVIMVMMMMMMMAVVVMAEVKTDSACRCCAL